MRRRIALWKSIGYPCAAAACGVMLGGCVSAQPREPMPLTEVPSFSESGEAALADQWWLAFDDAALDERVGLALSGNYSLASAWQRLLAARGLARRVGAEGALQLDATGGVSRRESLTDDDDRTTIDIGLAASYEVDLWGRIDALTQAQVMRARATQAEYQAAAISLSGEVALSWYRLIEAQLQADLIASQLEVNRTFLTLLQERFDVGQIRQADVLRQEQLVESTREQLILQQGRLALLSHQLAVLEGRPPQDKSMAEVRSLPTIASLPALGLPSDLVLRRPDVRAAMWQLEAADREVAAAVSDQYPRLNLSASLQTVAERPADLFDDWLGSITAQAIAPLLDGGARRAEVQRTEAVLRERLADYGQSVLTAFQEVEDALALEQQQGQRVDSIAQQRDLAQKSVVQLRLQFLNGVGDYLAVLTALRDEQQLQRDLLQARLGQIEARIALHRALAGGFLTPREQPAGQAMDDTLPGQGPLDAE